jgi:chromosome segregation ATPase
MTTTIKDLRENRTRLEEQLDYMKLELETLTRFDKRREAMSDIETAFDKLNTYISEIDGKKKKTVLMLRKLQLLMDADRGKLSKVSQDVQTEDSHMQEFLAGDLKFYNPSFFS